uniref:Uncharacterized protein n=1 Tax=Oryza punctata TaxID=4537 RepID=A0A0E0LC77_ORYPU
MVDPGCGFFCCCSLSSTCSHQARLGDTGLLNHLLRHIANKIATAVPSVAAQHRQRPEYWLDPAELVALQQKAGVADPYWVPPPGWKPDQTS